MKWPVKVLIIILLLALIGVPPLVAGSIHLHQAEAAQNDLEASNHYELAAQFLFWRTDLYEMAGIKAHNDLHRSIYFLELSLEKGELSTPGQVTLGDAYLANGQAQRAIMIWENLLNSNQETSQVALRLAQLYHTSHLYTAETRALQLWLKADQDNPEASERLGRILSASAAPEALPLLAGAAASSPQAASRLNALITALQVTDDHPGYRLTRCGQALAGLQEWSLAEEAFNQAVNANPDFADAWAWLGLARQQNGMPGAQQAFENALKLEQRSSGIHAMLGIFWQKSGRIQEAIPEYQTATRLDPENPAWWQALGSAYAETDLTKAIASYTRAVDLAPQEALYWYALAAFCVEKNAYIEDYGLNAALRAFALDPKNPAYMDMLGRSQMALGQNAAAETMFRRALVAVDASPGQAAAIHFHLGLLYLQTSQSSRAKTEFENTRELDPEGPFGAQAGKLITRYFP